MWEWPEYVVERWKTTEPASILLCENSTSDAFDPWTLARPAKHPLLHLDVARRDQQRCVRRLAGGLGEGVVLIHQPADRPAIRGLPEPPPFERRRQPRKSKTPAAKLDPKDLNSAVKAGDRDLVKGLLESGAKPDRRYFGAGSATAIDCAVVDGQTEMLKLLLKYTSRPLPSQLLRTAVYRGHLGVINVLMDRGLQPDEESLTEAVTQRHVSIVRFLLSLGIRPSPKAIRRAAGIVEPSLVGVPRDVHRPILRMLKKAGAKPPDAAIRRLFDTL